MAWSARFYPPEFTGPYLQVMLDALVAMNIMWLKGHPTTPLLYESGVRYRREPPGHDKWVAVPVVLQRRYGDCEDLASWRAAELAVHGERAKAFPKHVRTYSDGSKLFHIVVRRGNGRVEDPSRLLGMGGRG